MKSLYSKLAAVLTGIFCVLALVFTAAAIFSTSLYQQEINQRLNRDLAARILAERPLIRDKKINKDAVKEIFHALMVINPGIEIYLLDKNGEILAFSAPEAKVKRKSVSTAPLEGLLSGASRLPVFGPDPRSPDGEKVFSAARIANEGKLQGYLYVILGGEIYDSVAETLRGSHILRLSAGMIIAGLLFALIAGLILFAVITGRLKKLSNAVNSFKSDGSIETKNLPAPAGKSLTDEIDQLSQAFLNMAERINQQMERLRESDAMRRELIANVSHDLRTPLSTLRSYIETLLLKDEQMSSTDRRACLETAIKHCERVNRLISELMELAKYESLEIKLQKEPFNIAELLSDELQKFQIEARKKDIEIQLEAPDSLPFALADIAMIERVFENLIENAIHHTPTGGKITLELSSLDNEVYFRVKDTGSGIAPEDVPHIFERFYRSGKNRSADSSHSGLGLAIAEKILRLHNRRIKVESTPGKGAAFTFSLECY